MAFLLENVGKTTAKRVRAQVREGVDGPMITKLKLGTIKPGESRTLHVLSAASFDSYKVLFAGGPEFTVNWVTPLGHPESYEQIAPRVG